jgi:hypothetical protein
MARKGVLGNVILVLRETWRKTVPARERKADPLKQNAKYHGNGRNMLSALGSCLTLCKIQEGNFRVGILLNEDGYRIGCDDFGFLRNALSSRENFNTFG